MFFLCRSILSQSRMRAAADGGGGSADVARDAAPDLVDVNKSLQSFFRLLEKPLQEAAAAAGGDDPDVVVKEEDP